MPESEDVGDRRVGSKDGEICRLPAAAPDEVLIRGAEKWERESVGLNEGEICRLPTAAPGEVLTRGADKWEAGVAPAAAPELIDIGTGSSYFVSKDAAIAYSDVGTECYMYSLVNDSTGGWLIKNLTIDITTLTSAYTHPLVLFYFDAYIEGGLANMDAFVLLDINAGAGNWASRRLQGRESLSHVRRLGPFAPFFVDLGSYKDEQIVISFATSVDGETKVTLYLDRWIQLFEKKG